jgi:ATP-binding cassette subfamily C (CFTR/MRP) protein 4
MISLLCAAFILAVLRELTIFNVLIRSTSNIHQEMAKRILRAKVVFFDSNPIGRILTRFSKDIVVLDLVVPSISVLMTYGFFRTVSVTISLCIINYWLLIPMSLMVVYFVCVMQKAAQAMVEA